MKKIVDAGLHLAHDVENHLYCAYKELHVYDNTDSFYKGRSLPVEECLVKTETKRLFTTDSLVQMYSYLFQSGYKYSDINFD